jgi:hypothetical protein
LIKVGVKQDNDQEYIVMDEYQNTSVDTIYALGDVFGAVELKPMATAAVGDFRIACLVELKMRSLVRDGTDGCLFASSDCNVRNDRGTGHCQVWHGQFEDLQHYICLFVLL